MTDDVFFATITELSARLRKREFSTVELVRAFASRLETLGPKYNALALSLTKDAENRAGEPPDLPDISIMALLRAALAENDRFMSRFDERLLRPRVLPVLARTIVDAVDAGRSVKEAFAPRAG